MQPNFSQYNFDPNLSYQYAPNQYASTSLNDMDSGFNPGNYLIPQPIEIPGPNQDIITYHHAVK